MVIAFVLKQHTLILTHFRSSRGPSKITWQATFGPQALTWTYAMEDL